MHAHVLKHVCHVSKEGGGEYSSDKLPHLGRFSRSEKSCGEAFISKIEKKKGRIKME